MTTSKGVELTPEERKRQQFERLPKWAQERINSLEFQVAEARNRVKDLSTGHAGTNVVVSRHGLSPDLELPLNSYVTFYMEPETKAKLLRTGIDVHHSQDAYGLELHVSVNTGGRLIVLPSAGNSVRLRIDKLH